MNTENEKQMSLLVIAKNWKQPICPKKVSGWSTREKMVLDAVAEVGSDPGQVGASQGLVLDPKDKRKPLMNFKQESNMT